MANIFDDKYVSGKVQDFQHWFLNEAVDIEDEVDYTAFIELCISELENMPPFDELEAMA